jgi:hypothetical protein
VTYLDFWDAILRPFGCIAWRNPNCLLGVQIVKCLSAKGRSE